jgi:hypothetical protein
MRPGKEQRKARTAALDSSMYESHHVSRHYEKRRQQSQRKGHGRYTPAANRRRSAINKRLPKLSLAVHAASHLILAAGASTGMGSDSPHFVPLMLDASRRMPLDFALADAGFDSEDNHRLARRKLGIRSVIPAITGRPGANGPKGHYRRLMRRRFLGSPDKDHYGQRWQAETATACPCVSRWACGREPSLIM